MLLAAVGHGRRDCPVTSQSNVCLVCLPGHMMALAACHVLCWPALTMAMPIAMAHVLTLSMSLGLAHDRWPPIAKYHDCGPALLSRHITRAYLVRAGQIHAIPCHSMPCKGGLLWHGWLFWQSEVCWWLLSRLFWQTVAELV